MQAEQEGARAIVERLRPIANAWDQANGDEDFPAERLRTLTDIGAAAAFVTLDDEAALLDLLTALRLIGGADLSLGRIFEGHVNAVQLVHAYGSATQRDALARDLAAGRVYGVWNTEPSPGMRVEPIEGSHRLSGAKSFATGAGHINRALITALLPDGGKQMILADLTEAGARVDNSAWRMRGMRGTRSGTLDFSDMVVGQDALIGAPGDYEREPRFSAGAWRFTAVQLGAVEALVRHWRDHLRDSGKADDPVQRARISAAIVAARSAALWVERAARLAEQGGADAIPHVMMTRGVVEEAGLLAMEGAARAIGTASFFADSRVDRITRDLGLYLRQPVPDQARDRAAAAWIEADRWGDDPWW